MSYIDSVNVGGTPYKIQETSYITPSLSSAAYTAALTNFTLATGATVQAKFATTNPANATLNVNSTGAKDIFYNNAKITANQFKVNHVYTLVYDGTQWQVVGDISTGTVTQVSTGAGLTGGDITVSGTVKADLTSETKLTNAATDGTETSGRVYPVRLDKNGKLAVNVPWTDHYAWGDITGKPTSIALTGAVTASATTLGNGAISIATTSNHSHGNIDKDGKMTNANRLVWTGTDLKPQSTYHYATTDKIAINSTSAPSYNLYVNGTIGTNNKITLTGTDSTTAAIAFSRTSSYNYITVPADGSLALGKGQSSADTWIRLISTSLQPERNNEIDLGINGVRWKSAYLTTSLLVGAASSITAYNSNAKGSFVGPAVFSSCVTAAGDGYYLFGKAVQYGRLYIDAIGVAGTNTTTYTNPNDSSQTKAGYSGATTGKAYLILGNNKAAGYNGSSYNSPGSAGTADNAQGFLRLFSDSTGSADLTAYTGGDKTRIQPVEGFAIPHDKIGIMFRPSSSSYYTHFSYETAGNEALVMATQNAVTSFIFVNGESYANVSASRWQNLDGSGASGKGNAPGLQIKKNCVSIGKLIANGTDPSYKLEVKGTTNLDGAVTVPHTAGASDGVRIKYSTPIDFFIGVGTGNETHGLYDYKAAKWILYANAPNTWTFDGNATSATKATKSGITAIWMYPEHSNEINFGGTDTGTTLYFGYRTKDSRAIPTKFIFGSSTGTADLQAKTLYLGSGTTSYISSTQYTGNAATATKVKVTNTIPSSTTSYYLTYTDSTTSGNQDLRNSASLYFYDTGTTGYLNVGNASNSGGLTLHNANGKYVDIVTSAFDANKTLTIPNKTGTIALTSDLTTVATSDNLISNRYLTAYGGTIAEYDPIRHMYTITPTTDKVSGTTGLVISNNCVYIPWGYNFILSCEIYSTVTASFSYDENTGLESGYTGNHSSNDWYTGHKGSSNSIAANTWTKVWYSHSNTDETKNPNHGGIWEYTYFGITMNENTKNKQFKIRNVYGYFGTDTNAIYHHNAMESIKNITRNGTTFTATRLDGSTFTFTQQDNNSLTGVKGNAESSYRTGNVNLTPANIGAATSDHTHTLSIAEDNGTNALTLAYGKKYKLTAGGSTYIFTMPASDNTNNAVTQTISSTENANYRLLLSGTADDTTRTEGARKDTDFWYNPSTNILNVEQLHLKREFKLRYTNLPQVAWENKEQWWKIAQVSNYFNFDIYTSGAWDSGKPTVCTINITNINGTVSITQKAGGSPGVVGTKIKLGQVSTNTWDVLIYTKGQSTGNRARQEYWFFGFGGLTTYAPTTEDTTIYTTEKILTLKNTDGVTITTENVETGDNNGQIKFAGKNISVQGLGSAAYTASTSYAPAAGSSSIATVGTITSGTWQGNVIGIAYGGTGLSKATPHYALLGPSSGTTTGEPTWRAIDASDLPTATTNAKGIVQIGSGITVNNGTISVSASNLGLSNAMHFIGIATVAITDGSTTDPVISGYTFGTNGASAKAGDVVIDKDTAYEYVWTTSSKWERLGGDSSYKTVQTAVSSATAETDTATTFVYSVTQNTNGVITVKTRPLPTYNNYSHPTGDGNLHVPATGTGNNGKFLKAGSTAGSISWASITWNDVGSKPNRAGSDSDGGPAQTVKGAYTTNGGQQNPNYFGKNKVGFLMMNTKVNNNTQYKDWIIMDCYNGSDVDGGVAFGVNRQALGAYIMRSAAARETWAESAELIGTHNYTTYTVKKDGTGATGSWNISITGTAEKAIKDNDGNAINSTYLKLSGGTMTDAINLVGNQSSAYNDKGLIFTNGSRIGENTNGGLGIYAAERIYLRPNSPTSSSGDGIEISSNGMIPSYNNTETLGDSTHKWSNIYATTLYAGNFTIGGTVDTDTGKRITSSSTFRINRPANCSIAFEEGTTVKMSINTSNNFVPATDNTLQIGESNKKWNAMYATTFYGALTGNVTGNATSATTATYIKCTDTRNTALNPTDLNAAQGIRFDFKAKGTINLTATDPYAGVMSFRPYASNSDWTGGNAHQLAFNSEGLHWRNGGASWGDWYQILDSNNTSYGTDNASTLEWNKTYTIAKINGTDIKFTTMDKPTYTYSDVGAAPYIQGVFYGTCTTDQATKAKQVILTNGTGFSLATGAVVIVKFTNASAAATMTMAISNDGGTTYCTAKNLYRYGTTTMSSSTTTDGWRAGSVVAFVYDGTGWERIFWENSTYWTNSCYVDTAAATVAKVGTSSFYQAVKGYLQVTIRYTNTADNPTLNINGKGAKPIYMNGTKCTTGDSKSLPAGTYLVYYDGTNYYFRTDDKLTANITGTAANVTGTVAIANGGTGATDAAGARTNLGITAANVVGTGTTAQFYRGDNSWSDTLVGPLYTGNLTIGGTVNEDSGKTIACNATLLLDRPSGNAIIFRQNGTNKIRIDSNNAFRPESASNDFDIGTSARRWRTGYFSTSLIVGATNGVTAYNSNAVGSYIGGDGSISVCLQSTGGGYYIFGNGVQYARMFIHEGTANSGDGYNTRGNQGYATLTLGNDIARVAAGTEGGGNNARGRIYLYHTDDSYTGINSETWYGHHFQVIGNTSTTQNATGTSYITIGNNSKKSSTDASSTGYLRIYGDENYYHEISPGSPTAHRTHYFPNAPGWIVTGGNGTSTGAGDTDTPVYLKSDGTLAAITSYDGNAASATKVGTGSIWLYPESNNKLNFGGTNNSTTIYLGYAAKDSRGIPTQFIFGGSTGTADIRAAKLIGGSGNFTLQWNSTDSSIDFVFA